MLTHNFKNPYNEFTLILFSFYNGKGNGYLNSDMEPNCSLQLSNLYYWHYYLSIFKENYYVRIANLGVHSTRQSNEIDQTQLNAFGCFSCVGGLGWNFM